VSCNLQIGLNDGSSTHFQVGSEARPKETLIVRGTVRVYPIWLTGENEPLPHGRLLALKRSNRLTLGVKGRPAVRARLLIDNQARAGHTLTVGGLNGNASENFGGSLHVYNSTIAPFGDVRIGDGAPVRSVYTGGTSWRIKLASATISGVAGRFGRHLTFATIEDTRFENCGVALQGNYLEEVRGCTFVGNNVALRPSTRRNLTLYDCTFKDNKVNWSISYRRLIAVDCTIDSPDKGEYSTEHATFFVAKRHVVVRVLDQNGKPVEGARVKASSAEQPAVPEMDVTHALSGNDGRTPGRNAKGALLLSEVLIRAPTQEGARPLRKTYRYTIQTHAGGRTGRVQSFVPTKSWGEIVVVLGGT